MNDFYIQMWRDGAFNLIDPNISRDKFHKLIKANEDHLASARKTLRTARATSEWMLSLGVNYAKFMRALDKSIHDIEQGAALIGAIVSTIEITGYHDTLAYELNEFKRYITNVNGVKNELCKLRDKIVEAHRIRVASLRSNRKYLYAIIFLLFVILMKLQGIGQS